MAAHDILIAAAGGGKEPKVLAVAHTSSPNITAFPWTKNGFAGAYTSPATLPAGNGNGVAFSPSGNEIAVAHASTPFVTAYPWTELGFGTKFADPSSGPADNVNAVTFSPDGTLLVVAVTETSGASRVYKWSSSGFGGNFGGTLFSTQTCRGVAFGTYNP